MTVSNRKQIPELNSSTPETEVAEGHLEEGGEESKEEKCFSNISLEPVLFFFNIASQIVWITSQDLMEQKACKVNLEYPDFICTDLSNYKEEESNVQVLVSDLLMWRSILEASIKLVSVPFLGWWGDLWGPKYPLIFCLFSLGSESFVYLVNALASSWPLEVMTTGSFFYGLSGGTYALLMLSYSAIAKASTTKRRTRRFGILDGFYYLGSPIGSAIASPLFNATGYVGVFGTAVVIYALAITYILTRIRSQNVSTPKDEPEHHSNCCSDCGYQSITNAFYTTFKKRPSKTRRHILMLIFTMLLDSFVIWGEMNVRYLFTQKALNWHYSQYNHYGMTSSLLSVIGALCVLPLLTNIRSLHDLWIGVIGSLSRAFERAAYASATSPNRAWLMYFGAVLGTGTSFAPISIRSQLSKLAYDDVGQVYAVMAVGESLLPFISSPIYKSIYESTLDSYPGAYNLFSLSINLLMGTSFVCIYLSMRKQEKKLNSAVV